MDFERKEAWYMQEYKKLGFVDEFYLKHNLLVNTLTAKEYEPGDIYIVAKHRFPGVIDPNDYSVLYIIKTFDGLNGTVLVSRGPTGNIQMVDFFEEIPNSHFNDDLTGIDGKNGSVGLL